MRYTAHLHKARLIFSVCLAYECVAYMNELRCTPTLGEIHLQCVVAHMKVFLSHIHAAHRLQAKLISICVSYMHVSYYMCITHDDASCDTYK